ncbi:MAG: NUDIX domain-containing protein, partial [Actinobacteria bacterium]
MAGEDIPAGSDEPPPRKRRRRRRPKPASAAAAGTQGGARVKPISATRSSRGRKPAAVSGTSGARTSKAKGASKKKTTAKGTSRRRIPTQREVSAGGVVYRRGGDDIEVVLASRRTRRGDLAWGLAKGGIEAGESREDAAVREVREETGLDA